MKILAFMANGTEDSELIGTLSLIKRAGVERYLISVEDTLTLKGSHGNTIVCDNMLKDLSIKELLNYDAIFIPGGKRGVDTMKSNKDLLKLISEYNKRGKPLFSICAGPAVLNKAGVMDGINFTCYDGFEDEIKKGIYHKEGVVKDKNIITSRSVAYVTPFGLEIIKYLISEEESLRVKKTILIEE